MRGINKLSAAKVAKFSEPGRYGDGGGLWLQISNVGPRITKAWLFRFMLDGRARQMGLGSVDTFSLAEARERARKARQLVSDGIDPIEARLAERDARRAQEAERITFKEAATRFLDVHAPTWRNPKHRQQWRNTLSQYAYPKLGTRPVAAITAALVNEAIEPIHRTIPETASRVKQRIERVLQWVKDGFPAPIESAAKRVEHHAALAYAELPTFMEELRTRDSISAKALEFTVLTAARTGETIGAKWSEIDLAAKVWTIPASRMKAHKPHAVPLSDRAVALLKDLPRERGNQHVFVGAKAGAGISNMSMAKVLKLMGYNGERATVHGFRATFKTWAGETTAYPREIVEAALAHTLKNKVEAAYERGDKLDKRRRLMADWSRFCSQKPVARHDNVTPLRAS